MTTEIFLIFIFFYFFLRSLWIKKTIDQGKTRKDVLKMGKELSP